MSKESKRVRLGAIAVGAGIALSRLAGVVRERVLAHYLGNSEAAGAFKAALRIPGLLQNLFGEGVLSASFIPVYSRLRAEGKEDEANHVARVVFTALLLVVSLATAIGVSAAPWLIDLIAPGFEGPVRELTVDLVEIIFPGVGLLVISAWCLGVLNSHRRFFLSYAAPVMWNAAQIAALVAIGVQVAGTPEASMRLTHAVAWGTVAGAFLQLVVQLPLTIKLMRGLGLSLSLRSPGVRTVFSSFVPVVVARGVVQLSAYFDQIFASFIGAIAVSAISFAQLLYLLPISLFGIAISAAELPEMASEVGDPETIGLKLRERIGTARLRMAFFVIPSMIAFMTIGDAIIAFLFQTGKFGAADTRLVWTILIGYSVGLFANTQGRLLSSAFYSFSDTKTPLRFALVRVIWTAVGSYFVVVILPERFGWSETFSAPALTAMSGTAAWIEFALLSRALALRVGKLPRDWPMEGRMWLAALAAGAGAFALHRIIPIEHPTVHGLVTVAVFGSIYFVIGALLGLELARSIFRKIFRR